MVVGGNQAGKGAKGLLMGKGSDQGDQKDKKKPISRSSRAGLQVLLFLPSSSSCDIFLISFPALFLFLCHPHAIRNTHTSFRSMHHQALISVAQGNAIDISCNRNN